MKKKMLLSLAIATGIIFTSAIPVSAAFPFSMTNPGFESGTLTGWTVSPGNSGSVEVKMHYDHTGFVSYDPVYGEYFALLENGDIDQYTTMSQDFTIEGGETLEVWFFFVSTEDTNSHFNDHSSITIYQDQTLIDTLCYIDITNTPTPWTDVYFTAPSTGTYTLRVDIVNDGDSNNPSFIGIDMDQEVYVVEVNEEVREVNIDIKPSSCPNPLNVKSKGVLPVAILGTEDFDVSEIDPATVSLEGIAPLRWDLEDVATPVDDGCSIDGRDGFIDLTLKFDIQELIAKLAIVTDREEQILMLEGELFDDTSISGEDVVLIMSK